MSSGGKVSDQSKIEVYTPGIASLERRTSAISPVYKRADIAALPDLRAWWQIIWNRRRTVLATLLVVFDAVLLGSLLMTPIYEASGSLQIGRENPDVATVQTLTTLDKVADDFLQTQFQVLQSEALASRVIHELHLDKFDEFTRPPLWSPCRWVPPPSFVCAEPTPNQIFQTVLAKFQKKLDTQPVAGSRLVNVTFDSESPVLAAKIVNSLFSNYTDLRLQPDQKSAGWLAGELMRTKSKLKQSDRELQNYVRKTGLVFLETDKGQAEGKTSENIVNQRFLQLQQELTKAQAERYQKEPIYRLVQQGNYGSLPGVADNKLMQDLTERLADAKRTYAMLAATFTDDYPKVKEAKNQVAELEAILERERERAAELISNDYLAAVRREDLLRQAFQEQQNDANSLAGMAAQYTILKHNVESNRQLYDTLQQKIKESNVAQGLKVFNVAEILDFALPPVEPQRPKLPLNLALAVVVGLMLGVGSAFLEEHLDTTLRTPEEVDRFLGVPALGVIPSVESIDGRRPGGAFGTIRELILRTKEPAPALAPHWYRIDQDSRQHSALIEAFGCLRTSVLLNTASPPPRSLLVSSSQPGEGKTTISINLAMLLAQLGQRVLLIDADIRCPAVQTALGLMNGIGLVNYLVGEQDWPVLVQTAQVEGLEVLAAGPTAAQPTELLSSSRMRELVSRARQDYDFVVLDSPALLINAADARILAPLVDGVVLVIRSGATPREVVQRARAQAPNVVGVVLNQVNAEILRGYYPNYGGLKRTYIPPGDEREYGQAL